MLRFSQTKSLSSDIHDKSLNKKPQSALVEMPKVNFLLRWVVKEKVQILDPVELVFGVASTKPKTWHFDVFYCLQLWLRIWKEPCLAVKVLMMLAFVKRLEIYFLLRWLVKGRVQILNPVE